MARRQRWLITLYVLVAIPLAVAIYYLSFAPFPSQGTKYLQNVPGISDMLHAPPEPPDSKDSQGAAEPYLSAEKQEEDEPEPAEEEEDDEELQIPAIAHSSSASRASAASQTKSKSDASQTGSPSEPQAVGSGSENEADAAESETLSASVQSESPEPSDSKASESPQPSESEASKPPSNSTSEAEASITPSPSLSDAAESQSPTESEASKTSGFIEDKWWFQADLDDYKLPEFDIPKLVGLAPHNYRGPGHETFATYFATRNATLHDPYFIAALQIVFRVLWHPDIKSQHPMTVFVAPFVPKEHREYFAAAGALVREVSLIPFEPDGSTQGRWKDQLSKLEMWRQTDFSRIAYIDSDAFPINNTDAILDLATEQKCNRDLLPEQDKPFASSVCKYVFAAAWEFISKASLSAAVMVLQPNRAMYEHLLRRIDDRDKFDTKMMEQALLNYTFRDDGPFPFNQIPDAWNAPPDYRDEGKEHYFIHDKMWAHFFDPGVWVLEHYKQVWADMLKFYESEEFVRTREEDQEHMLKDLE